MAQCPYILITFCPVNLREEDQSKYIKGTREPFDLGIYKAFRDAGKPVLGICLGHQMINVAQGGTLNPKAIPVVFGTEHGSSIAHTVKAEPGSVLAKLLEKNSSSTAVTAFLWIS